MWEKWINVYFRKLTELVDKYGGTPSAQLSMAKMRMPRESLPDFLLAASKMLTLIMEVRATPPASLQFT